MHISCNLSARRKHQRWRVGGEGASWAGAGKFTKVELGNRCEWGGRGPSREGWRLLCVSAWARINVHARAVQLCMQDRPGKGQDMSAHGVSGSFTRCDHFTLPPEAFFPPKAFSCSWLSTCREGAEGLNYFSLQLAPKLLQDQRKEGKKRGERGIPEKLFVVLLPLFSLHRLPLFHPGNMDQGAKSPALRLLRAGRVARLLPYCTYR